MNLKTLFLLGIGAVILICGVTALIISLVGKKYTVTFDSNGGSKIDSIVVKGGNSIERPKDPKKADYELVEWQLDGKKYDFDAKVTKNITLKAVWKIKLTDDIYTITFDTAGGSEIEEQKVNGNGTVTKPDDPIKPHNKFVEWQLDEEKYDFDSLVRKDITLVATWTMLPNHDVTFDSDGGDQSYRTTVFEGDAVKKPEDPKKDGYKFIEWQKDGQKYDFNTPVIDDITITAKWEEAKKYEVKFYDGNEIYTTRTVTEGDTVTKPNDPSKTNKQFAGWLLEGKEFDFNTVIDKDISLTAKWEDVKICNVTLADANTFDKYTLSIKCGTKITSEQVVKAIEKDCIDTYGKEKASYCCQHLGLSYYKTDDDLNRLYQLDKFDYNTIIEKDIKLAFILSRGVAEDGKTC